MQLIPLILLIPVLLAVAWTDLRSMRIPNVLSLIALAICIVTAPLIPMPEIGLRLAAAAITGVFGLILFGLRLMGGGDLKILTVLMLAIPSRTWIEFGWLFSASVLLGAAFLILLRSAPWLTDSSWITIRARSKFPLGLSIAMAGIAHPFFVNALASL